MAEKNSLWKNIRNKAKQNRRTGATPKKPTAEMLRQERKIKAQKANGGPVGDDDLMLSNIYNKYPAFRNMGNVTLKADTGFTKENTGIGDIEFFDSKTKEITYPNGYKVVNPSNNGSGIIYNPKTNTEQNIMLDMLHGMPSDPVYNKIKSEFGDAYLNSKFSEDFYNDANTFKKEVGEEKWKEWYGNDKGFFDKSYLDGVIRNLMFEGTPEDFEKNNYWQDARKEYFKDAKIKTRYKQLENYLKTGKGYVLPEVEIFSDETKANGGPTKSLVQPPVLLDDDIIYPTDNPYMPGVNKDILDSEYDSYMRWRENLIRTEGVTPEEFFQTYPSRQEWERKNFDPANLHNGVSLAQGGYVDGDDDKKKKTRVYTDPREFRIAQQNYNDSLAVANQSQILINAYNRARGTNTGLSSTEYKKVKSDNPNPNAAILRLNRPKAISKYNINITDSPKPDLDHIKIFKEPEEIPVLRKEEIEYLPSKPYKGETTEPTIIPNPSNVEFGQSNMNNFFEGTYEKYRRSPYEDPMYRVWVSGQQQQIVPESEFKKLSDQYLLKDLEAPDPGGNLYDKPKATGGHMNPYMYYAGGPMYYDVGGKVWKNIAAGLYGAGEGILDTITMGATDQLTDKGFDWLTKVGNKNIDLNDPDDVKFLKTQQQIKGYSNAAGAIGTAIFTGNVQGAIGQGTKGLNTAFQASDWASDDFKKWSQGISGVAGLAAGFAGGLNSDSFNAAAKAGTGVAGFGQKAGKIGSFGNQAMGMVGGNKQSLFQQAQAREELLKSPEYLAMQAKGTQDYVNQGLSFAANGGPLNNEKYLVNSQIDSMRNRYKTYKTKYSRGGKVQDNAEEKLEYFGMTKVPNYSGFHYENPNGGSYGGENASFEKNEIVLHAKGGPTPGPGKFVFPSEVNGTFSRPAFLEVDKNGIPKPLNKTIAEFVEDEATKGSPFRKHNNLGEERVDAANQKAMEMVAYYDQLDQQQEQQRQAMVNGALQIAAAGGKLNKDLETILSNDIQSYVEADNYYAYGGYLPKDKGFNMPNSYAKGGSIHIKKSKRGTFTAAAKKRGKSVQEFAKQVLANKGNYSSAMVKKANFARNAAGWKHAVGGPLYGNTDSEYTYAHGGPVVSNVNQGFGLYAQNRGGMMMAQGGMMQQQGGQDQMMQLIQAYAQATGVSPEEIIQQLQQMEPQDQQQAIQQMAQEMQGGQQQGMARGGNMYAVGGGPGDELDPEQLKAQGYVEYDNYFYNPTTGQYVDKPSNRLPEEEAMFQRNIERFMQPGTQFDERSVKPLLGLVNNTGIEQMPINTGMTTLTGGVKKPGMENIIGDDSYVEGTRTVTPRLHFNSSPEDYSGKYNLQYVDPYTLGGDEMLDQRYPILDREGNVQTTPEDFARLQTVGSYSDFRNKYFTNNYNQVMSTRDKVRRAYENKSPYLDNMVDESAKPNKSNTYLRNLNTPNYVDNQGNTSSILSRRNKNKSTPVEPIERMQSRNLQQLPTDNTPLSITNNYPESSYRPATLTEEEQNMLDRMSNTVGFIPSDVMSGKLGTSTAPFPYEEGPVDNSIPKVGTSIEQNISFVPSGGSDIIEDLPGTVPTQTKVSDEAIGQSYLGTAVNPNLPKLTFTQSDATKYGLNPNDVNITDDTKVKQPNQGLTGLDYAMMGIGSLGALDRLRRGAKGPDPVNFERIGFEPYNYYPDIVLADDAILKEREKAAYDLKQYAPSSGSYMANRRALGLGAGKTMADQRQRIKSAATQFDLARKTGIDAQNAQIQMQESIARQQELDAARENVTEGLDRIGNRANMGYRDYKIDKNNQTIANNIGTTNWKVVDDGKGGSVVVFKGNDGSYKAIPYQQATTPNTSSTTASTGYMTPVNPNTTTPVATAAKSFKFDENITDKTKGDAFRAWVNKNYPRYAKNADLSLSGVYNNDYIKDAWDVYGEKYLGQS
jgi:hypothetical protein